ncbi:uncharacterized protein BBA_02161 [Beauveria bassiana ARSEF 2860]|uniref:Uncharacterized protein n=1 Tax=Beauveria bassiana (strain ARSEF 2860) TaxID=655819 RepID=J5K4X6_BEAB2|nr:uncharacterized protein BBA_02161 [Beauveria bassiana ARSEF 2860]EJP69126.1 hypothetical protein BBA_02161 [Beauveria bassiana ARSEF 2860]
MKASLTLILAAALGALASPVDHVIHRRFTCADRLDGYCHASNVNSYCENGEFRSKAYETCKNYCRHVFSFFFLPAPISPSVWF